MVQELLVDVAQPEAKLKSFTASHSYYNLPNMSQIHSKSPTYSKVISKVYEFIGLPSHMPLDIRKQIVADYNPNAIVIVTVKWNLKGRCWNLLKVLSKFKSPLVKFELYVAPAVSNPILAFALQFDYGFTYMNHIESCIGEMTLIPNRNRTHAYRHKSLLVCRERAVALPCSLNDMVDYHTGIINPLNNQQEVLTMSKSDLIEWLDELIVENEFVLADINENQAVLVKYEGIKYFVTKKEYRLAMEAKVA